GSWMTPRAVRYRELNNITGLLGTAVNVQVMVFGNMGEDCGTGVAFTRDPATGANTFYGEYLMNAQGEDVVAGIRTPQEIQTLARVNAGLYEELVGIRNKLERHYRDMQDLEFTIERGELFMLQTRTGKRTAAAAVKMAIDMMNEKLITEKEAVLRVDPRSLDQLLHPMFDPAAEKAAQIIARGLPASPGAATGQIVFDAHTAEEWQEMGRSVILVRVETSPEDIGGMAVAKGILTSRGGMTSHAAVVARGMGKCCVAGCEALQVDYRKKLFRVGRKVIKQGDWISLDGASGEVMEGQVPTRDPELSRHYYILMKWVDQIRRLKVRTNADTPEDSKIARDFGAEGIGLCRTEHMFFEGERINAMREMILAETEEGRRAALKKLLPMQRKDFEGIFKAMDGLPVTIRLLDPPLHEFLPHEEDAVKAVAKALKVKPSEVRRRAEALVEFNPMLGHRGCRLGITYPEISQMQARAIFEAACNVTKRGVKVLPEVMIPLIGTEQEFNILQDIIVKIAEEVMKRRNIKVKYLVGTMIEIPRACLVADKVAQRAEFFSFGTNDLTQMTYGYSRDDSGRFLDEYVANDILPGDPFQSLDAEGVGQLVDMGTRLGRSVNPKLKVGVCGEHGGDPESVIFFHNVGLDYVSCSPYRVPIARLAAAQAVLEETKTTWRDK
ncbi:MAG: pyruvate, phosphate dikinase, partial [Candidatus Brocadiae bacterium]|nr:pyruvate, phosphate dikinase [Candidatus Brocadiia bacterium]